MRHRLAFVALLVLSPHLFATPPSFDPPAEIIPVNGYAFYKPKADVVAVEYVALDGEGAFPLDQLGASKTAFFFPTRGLPGKRYRFVGIGSSSTGELVRKDFAVVIGGPPVTEPPVEPPTQPTASLYFAVIRANGPASPEFSKFMADTLPQWRTLQAAGHQVRDMPLAEATGYGIKGVTVVPCVAVLRKRPDGNSDQLGAPLAFPKTADDVLNLPKAVK